MTTSPELAGLEALLKERGVAPRKAFQDAGVAYSNWSRWKRGKTSPNVETLRRLREAVAAATGAPAASCGRSPT
jgi:transcriptional regulator with XRE-family HTH domain